MNMEHAELGRTSAGFGIAAAITILFSTALAWVKDAYQPLIRLMNALAWHNWITHGIADVVLFVGLGLIFSRADWPRRIMPNRLISLVTAAVLIGGVSLFVWYAVF